MDQDELRICAVCGRVLEETLSDPILYRHAAMDRPEDHPPVAVRPADAPVQARYRCDFCEAEPITHTLVADREIGAPEINMVYSREWAMCATCAVLALTDDWLNLRRHAFQEIQRQHGPFSEEAKLGMRVVFRDLRKHLVMFYLES